MRLKSESAFYTIDKLYPCYNIASEGQTIDYLVNITATTPCSGSVTPGAAISTATAICKDTPFQLDLNNNDQVSNVSYTWQSSTDAVNWSNITTPQSTVPFSISSQSVTTYYKCNLTCNTSTITTTSSTFTLTQKVATECYCIPEVANCNNFDVITSVVFSNLTNTSSCSVDGYEDYTKNASITTPTVHIGQNYTMDVTVGKDNSEFVAVWIDYNQDGAFDTNEYTNFGGALGSGNYTITGSINIPSDANIGYTRMRVRTNYAGTLYDNQPCDNASMGRISILGTNLPFGETEDYLIKILPPDCNTFNSFSSVALTGSLNICQGGTSTLDLSSAMPNATGFTYQWKQLNGAIYTDLGTASTTSSIIITPTVTTDYYCEIFCNSNSFNKTDTVNVKIHTITSSPNFTNVTCYNSCNGIIDLNATTAYGSLTYNWTPSQTNSGF